MDKKQHIILTALLCAVISFLILTALFTDGFLQSVTGFLQIQIGPARLLSDFIEMQGMGAALLNAAVVGLIGLLCIYLAGITLSGVTFAAVLTIIGFGFFGKTAVNIFPVIFGVFLAAKTAKRTFKEYIVIALFGTALGPVFSFIAFETGWSLAIALPVSIAAGVLTGFVLPAVALSMLHLHQGYSLYNIGLTCGFLGLFAASFFKTSGASFAGLAYWYNGSSPVLIALVPAVSFLFIITAVFLGKTKVLSGFLKVQKETGRLPSDFFTIVSLEAGLFNAGVIGIAGTILVALSGAPFNGPVLGGLFTIIGFGAFGTHPRNSWPVVAGVAVSAIVFGLSLSSPGVILALLFCTTLAPLSGQFGILIGLAAGFTHMAMVSQTGTWQGTMNLYNNGFAGGLTAALFVAIIQWFKNNTNISFKVSLLSLLKKKRETDTKK